MCALFVVMAAATAHDNSEIEQIQGELPKVHMMDLELPSPVGSSGCKPLKLASNVDHGRMLGTWFKTNMSRFIYETAQHKLSCIGLNMTSLPPRTGSAASQDGSTIFITERSHKNGAPHIEHAYLLPTHQPSVMELHQNDSWVPTVPYEIIDVVSNDGGEYIAAIIGTCALAMRPGVWVMSRSRQLPPEVPFIAIQQRIENAGMDFGSLHMLPVPQPSTCGP